MSKLNTSVEIMEKPNEDWIDDIFNSLSGSQRAKPAADLFAKIEAQINQPEPKIISTLKWQPAIAAAILLLILNVFALRSYTQSGMPSDLELSMENDYETSLISNFQLYDE
ncbi:MAG: hypothetical protein IPL46_21905 [Saprospiraceae bacterium]|nr:hypothetical protein [Saprospiraceae bacterium]